MTTPDFDRAAVLDLIGFGRGATTGVYIPIDFVRWLGSYESAAFLNQILYWRDVARAQGRDTFYKTAAQWRAELGLTDRQVRTAIARVRAIGVDTVCRKDPTGKRALFYSVDPDRFIAALMSFRQNANVQNVHKQMDETYISYNTENTNKEYIDQPEAGPTKGSSKRRQPTAQAPPVDELVAALSAWFHAQPNNAGRAVVLRDELEAMVDYHRANGRAFADWVAAGRTWVRRSLNPPAGSTGAARGRRPAAPRPLSNPWATGDGATPTTTPVDDGGAAVIRATLSGIARDRRWAAPTRAQVAQAVAVRAAAGDDLGDFTRELQRGALFAQSIDHLIGLVDVGVIT